MSGNSSHVVKGAHALGYLVRAHTACNVVNGLLHTPDIYLYIMV